MVHLKLVPVLRSGFLVLQSTTLPTPTSSDSEIREIFLIPSNPSLGPWSPSSAAVAPIDPRFPLRHPMTDPIDLHESYAGVPLAI